MTHSRKLLLNTLILTLMSFLMRTIGVSFHVYLTNKIGAAGIGLFQLVMTVYGLAVTVGTAGVRLSATRLAVEQSAAGKSPARALRFCMGYGLLLGLFAALCLFFGADLASRYWLQDLRAASSLRILALSLPPIAVSAALGGYFTAAREIPRFSLVNLMEQGAKISIVVLAFRALANPGLEQASCVIVSGITAAEYVSCLLGFLLYCWLNKKQEQRKKGQGSVMRRLMRIALPDGVGSVARSILLTVEHLLIPIGFRKSGASAQTSMATYGVIHGMTLQLLLYPSALLTSLSSLLVPELAEQHAQKNNTRIALITARVLKMTMLFAVGTAGILYAYATPLSMRVYGNADAAEYIRLLAPLIPVMYLDMTVDGILKGLDQQFYSMRYNLLDSGLCVLLVYLLIPRYGVKGYIFILFASEILNFYLSIGRLIRVTQVKLELMEGVVQPLFCVLAAFFMVRLAFGNLGAALGETGSLVLWIGLNAAIYLCFLRWVGSLTRADTQWIQGLLSRNKTKTLGVQTKLQNKAAKPRS